MTHPDYFEGVLQLRNPTKKVIEFVLKEVVKAKVTIAKQKKVNGGIDYYMSSQKFLTKLGKMLSNKFSGDVKINRKLFTRKRLTSKNVYRVNVLFRVPNFKRGDVLIVDGKEVKVFSLGKNVVLKDLKSGKKIIKPFDYVNKLAK